jgi:hypothetical protein
MWHFGAALKKHLSFMRVCFRGMFPSMLVSFNFVTCLLLRCLSLTFVAIVRLCYFKERLFLFFIFIFTPFVVDFILNTIIVGVLVETLRDFNFLKGKRL